MSAVSESRVVQSITGGIGKIRRTRLGDSWKRPTCLLGFFLLTGCAATPAMSPRIVRLATPAPPIPSPPGGGCQPFASLVPGYPNRPISAEFASSLVSAGYAMVSDNYGRAFWICQRPLTPTNTTRYEPTLKSSSSAASSPSMQSATVQHSPAPWPLKSVRPQSPILAPLPASASVKASLPAAESTPEKFIAPPPALAAIEPRAQVERLLPKHVADRSAWAGDIVDAFDALKLPASTENVCATIAVIDQESSFHVDPIVPGLPQIAWRQIEDRREQLRIPRRLVDTFLALRSSDGRSYKARIDSVRTERELSTVYEDFIAQVPMGRRLFGRMNPVHTLGSMQVSMDFVEAYAKQRPFPSASDNDLRAVAFSRRGGIYFGTAHLLDYPAQYEMAIYRFADFNAGRYASRNAALQSAIGRLSGLRLTLDGDLLIGNGDGEPKGETLRAALSLGPQLKLDQAQIANDLSLGRSRELEQTQLYRRVFQVAERMAGKPLPRAVLPTITLRSPKIRRKNLTTSWFAQRVDSRYRDCLARDTGESSSAGIGTARTFVKGG